MIDKLLNFIQVQHLYLSKCTCGVYTNTLREQYQDIMKIVNEMKKNNKELTDSVSLQVGEQKHVNDSLGKIPGTCLKLSKKINFNVIEIPTIKEENEITEIPQAFPKTTTLSKKPEDNVEHEEYLPNSIFNEHNYYVLSNYKTYEKKYVMPNKKNFTIMPKTKPVTLYDKTTVSKSAIAVQESSSCNGKLQKFYLAFVSYIYFHFTAHNPGHTSTGNESLLQMNEVIPKNKITFNLM